MSAPVQVQRPTKLNRAWLAVPLVLFALISLDVGVIAHRTVQQPYTSPYIQLVFSDTLHMKVWLASGALLLAIGQMMTASRIYGLLRFPPKGRFYNVVHRWSGRTAVVLTIPVAYHCIFLLGFGTYDTRVYIHSLLGSMVYGAVVAKVLLVRSTRFPGWMLPIAGSLLFTIILGLWLTSALWFFSTYGVGL